MAVKHVALFAGNNCYNSDKKEAYLNLAREMGKCLAEAQLTLITGAGDGLMEAAAQGASEAGGEVWGIGLNLENRKQSPHLKTYETHDKLGPRQEKLIAQGEAYIALPGGIGTFHEIFHILALKRLKEIPNRPLIMIGDYFLPLKTLLEEIITQGFVEPGLNSLYTFVSSPKEAVAAIQKSPEA
jgi:uncharacterized protein (TIGR00730 family)